MPGVVRPPWVDGTQGELGESAVRYEQAGFRNEGCASEWLLWMCFDSQLS